MIYIKKKIAPRELTLAKKQPLMCYADLRTDVKEAIKRQLCDEQHHLCAYCMRRITVEAMTIEHYKPQSPKDGVMNSGDDLDYKNMLGVCLGGRGSPLERQTCDAHRGNRELVVNPLDQASINHITYSHDGEIKSEHKEIHFDLNSTLNLNSEKFGLPANRKAALDALKKTIKRNCKHKSLTARQAKKDMDKQMELVKYPQYAGILWWYLRRKL